MGSRVWRAESWPAPRLDSWGIRELATWSFGLCFHSFQHLGLMWRRCHWWKLDPKFGFQTSRASASVIPLAVIWATTRALLSSLTWQNNNYNFLSSSRKFHLEVFSFEIWPAQWQNMQTLPFWPTGSMTRVVPSENWFFHHFEAWFWSVMPLAPTFVGTTYLLLFLFLVSLSLRPYPSHSSHYQLWNRNKLATICTGKNCSGHLWPILVKINLWGGSVVRSGGVAGLLTSQKVAFCSRLIA